MAWEVIDATEVQAKAPVDDTLAGKIKNDLDDLNTRVTGAGSKFMPFELMGQLSQLANMGRSVALGYVNDDFVPSKVRWLLKKSGTGGAIAFDIRKHTQPKTPITAIEHQYTAATSSISKQGASLNTQSVSRAAAQINTQSITFAKAVKNIQSVVLLPGADGLPVNAVQYNLDAAIDADTVIGDTFVAAGTTGGTNDGSFVIIETNRGGGNNVVVVNAGAAAQTGIAGTIQETIMSFNYINPVGTSYKAGYSHHFSGHTTGANNGDFPVWAINRAGNNIWAKIPAGVVQAGVAGTADTNFWSFLFTAPAITTDYIVGEAAKTAAHTTGGNNAGALEIIAVNSGGDNVVLYNTAGATQGGIAGTVNTNRWAYNLPTDPTAQVTAGDEMNMLAHTTPANNGLFILKATTVSTVVVYNTAGVVQGGAAGNVYTTRKVISFAADQSAVYTTDSFIEMDCCADLSYNFGNNFASNAPFKVLQVNRGGGANYNVVIENDLGPRQGGAGGFVVTEARSIFTAPASIAASATGLTGNLNIAGVSVSVSGTLIPTGTPLMLYLTSMQAGDPQDLSIFLN